MEKQSARRPAKRGGEGDGASWDPEAAREDGFMQPWPLVDGLNCASIFLIGTKTNRYFLKVVAIFVISAEQ